MVQFVGALSLRCAERHRFKPPFFHYFESTYYSAFVNAHSREARSSNAGSSPAAVDSGFSQQLTGVHLSVVSGRGCQRPTLNKWLEWNLT